MSIKRPNLRAAACCCLALIFFDFGGARAQTTKNDYLRYVKTAADAGLVEYPRVLENWKKNIKPSELWGYDAPAQPIYLADALGFLYQETKEKVYAEKARDILASFGDLRANYPKEYQSKRAEYRGGIPAISNFFIMPPYARAYMRIRESGVLDAGAREKIEGDLAFSLDHTFYFPEWGAQNRAMLRAESLFYGAVALPRHPHAARWKQLAETLASDSIRQWEIEDASGYQAVWLYSLFSYAEISGRADIYQSINVKYYLDYFAELLTPHGNIADFGDSHWNANWDRFVPVFEKAATVYRNARYKYVARELTKRAVERIARNAAAASTVSVGVGAGSSLTDAYQWADDSITPQPPSSLSGEVLDDVIGKKIVFRTGWDPQSTFLLLNYRDEGEAGWLGREYLRQNLSVEEEKMTHGHSDENSVALLMSGGSVLLHDGGYRPDLPSGPWGAWRADYFHNRVVARLNKREKNQDVFEFIRNSGAYRPVRTSKIDFLKFKDVEASRTRLIDDNLGYQWDRVVTYVKAQEMFVVIDGIKTLKSDYFTFTNLWHTQKILAADKDLRAYDTAIDKIGVDVLPQDKALLVHFPENAAKQTGTYQEQRHFQDETAIYQTVSSFYNTGDTEFFVTVLLPHGRGSDARETLRRVRLMNVDQGGRAIGLEIDDGQKKSALCVKLDLEMDLARENTRPRNQYQLGKVKYGNYETDASFLFATAEGGRISYAAATMTKVLYRDQILMEALPNTYGLQLYGAPPKTGYGKWRFWEDTIRLEK